jgi:hypothetical protein
MEHLVLLAVALAQRKELMPDVCELCEGFVVRDRLSVANKPCIYCTTRTSTGKKSQKTQMSFTPASKATIDASLLQKDLFEEASASSSLQTIPPHRQSIRSLK